MTAETAVLKARGRPRLVDDIVRILREKIVRGELVAGTQLLQQNLADDLGVSRTPLREAFRILENDGLLRTSNNNRTVEVVTFDAAEIRDMFEVREVIDGLAARLSSRQEFTPEAQAKAIRLLVETAASSKPYDPQRRANAHAEFHILFVEQSGNSRLRALIPLIRVSTAALYLPFIADPGAVKLLNAGKSTTHKQLLDESQESHQAILDAVIEGDAAQSEAAARRHIRRTLGVVDSFDEWRRVIADAAADEHEALLTRFREAVAKAGD